MAFPVPTVQVEAVGGIRMREEADGARLRVWYEPRGVSVGREEGEAFVARVRAAVARPLQVLVDVGSEPDIGAEYRQVVGAWFRREPKSIVVAIVNLTAVIGVMLRMFALLTGVRARSFPSEAEALRWLEEETRARALAR